MADKLRIMSTRIKRLILDESFRAHVGHIGCSLSIADILSVLYGDFLSIPSPTSEKRDHFILSKGHAALGLYCALHLKGFITNKQLSTYHTDDSHIATHPEFGVPGIELMTGSLGQGLGVGVGIALAKKLKNLKTKTVVLLSDAECNEGSIWEAVAFCSHHKLNIIAVIDLNGQQGFGYTKDVLDMSPLKEKWKTFGWETYECDGHNLTDLRKVLNTMERKTGPRVLLARTKLGHGVSFMEGKVDWHYMPLSLEQYSQAVEEINHA